MSQGKRKENIVSEHPKEKKGLQYHRPVRQKSENELIGRTATN